MKQQLINMTNNHVQFQPQTQLINDLTIENDHE